MLPVEDGRIREGWGRDFGRPSAWTQNKEASASESPRNVQVEEVKQAARNEPPAGEGRGGGRGD